MVNERVILTPMEHLKTNNPELDMACILPKVHPKIEDPQRHYLEDDASSSPGFEIRRALRQRHRVNEGYDDGHLVYVIDFSHFFGNCVFDDMSLEDMERSEALLWRAGVDVDEIVAAMSPTRSIPRYGRFPPKVSYLR